MFGLIVIGSVVRTTGSGLACPDWPLCEGRLIPRFEIHVLTEWSHRLVALLLGGLLLATAAATFTSPAVRARAGGLVALALALYLVQALLGALTVWKLLDPSVVSGHLGVALLLFATLVVFTLVTRAEAGETTAPAGPRPAGLLGWCGAATAFAYGQSLLGGIVSTHHAGMACPDWPTCNGGWFPPLGTLEALQMTHRWGAYALTAVVIATWLRTRAAGDPGVRNAAQLAASLTLAQVVLGITNVLLATPVWLSAAHLATATAILASLVGATWRAAAIPALRPAFATAGATT